MDGNEKVPQKVKGTKARFGIIVSQLLRNVCNHFIKSSLVRVLYIYIYILLNNCKIKLVLLSKQVKSIYQIIQF